MILVEAPAGKGKSALLAIAADLATRAGLRVAAARATELEREFPFGVVIQLFEPHWMWAGAKEREHLVGGPARWAGELLDAGLRAMGSTSGEHAFAQPLQLALGSRAGRASGSASSRGQEFGSSTPL